MTEHRSGRPSSRLDLAITERLANLQWYIIDLPGQTLGMAANGSVWLDADAGGHGWFIDSSPAGDDEFMLLANDVLQAKSDGPAEGRIDLLTAVLHELGHLAGLHDETTDDLLPQLMDESLAPGVRKRPRKS